MEERIDGVILKNFRKSLSVSRKTFAYLAGVSRKEVKSWESGESYPDEEIIRKLFDLEKAPSRNVFLKNNKIQSGLFGSYCSHLNLLTGAEVLFCISGLILFVTFFLLEKNIFALSSSAVCFTISAIVLVVSAIRLNFLINYGIEFTVYKKVLKRKLFDRLSFCLIGSIAFFAAETTVFVCVNSGFDFIKIIIISLAVFLCILLSGYIIYMFIKSNFEEEEKKSYIIFKLKNFVKIFCLIFFISVVTLFSSNYIFGYIENNFYKEKEYSFYNKNRLIRFVQDSDLFDFYSYTFIENKYPLNKETEVVSVKCLFSDIRDESELKGYDYILDGYSAIVTVKKYNLEISGEKLEFYVFNEEFQNCDISVEYDEDKFEYILKATDHFISSLKTYATAIILSTAFIAFVFGGYIYYKRIKAYVNVA